MTNRTNFNLLSNQKRMAGPGSVVLSNKAAKSNINLSKYQNKISQNIIKEAQVKREVGDVLGNIQIKKNGPFTNR